MDDPRKTVDEAKRRVLRLYNLGYYDGSTMGMIAGLILGLSIGMAVSVGFMYNQRLHTAIEVVRLGNLIKEVIKKV
jgi:hypothetical protein